MSRAENRHHEKRIKAKVKKYYSGWAGKDPKKTGIVAHSKKLCSCLACGNRRKYEGKTIQERKVISATEYNKKMSAVIKKGMHVDQTLIEMLDIASRYDLQPE